ncbi:MAG: AsnC family protein [Aquabacterium sp.]
MAIDHTIPSHLAQDGLATFRERGEAVHLSPNAVAERYRRLLLREVQLAGP